MNYANPTCPSQEEADHKKYQGSEDNTFSEGYGGVALVVVEAFESGIPVHMAMNVPTGGAIDCMRATDVVEISCDIDSAGIHPLRIGTVPEQQELLMRTVKKYEHLAVESILK